MEVPETIRTGNPQHLRDWTYCEEFRVAPFSRFVKWLERHKIAAIPDRTERYRVIDERIKRRGLRDKWIKLKQEIGLEWSEWPECHRKVKGHPVFSRNLRNELLWRLSEELLVPLELSADEVRRAVGSTELSENDEGMEFLPPWMRWVANHPTLTITEKQELEDEVLRAVADGYLKKCPNQAAKNLFKAIRGDVKTQVDFWKQVGSRYSEEVKRTNSKPDAPVDEEVEEALEHVASLEEMLRE